MRRSPRPPDVIVVVLDTARTFDVSAVWPDGPRTSPTLERLAEESLVFPLATAPAPWTLPSHASLFTGLMPSRHGADELSMRLDPEGPPTMADILAAEGYATAGISCNDLVCPPTGLCRGYQRFVEERDAIPGGLDHSLVERLTLGVRGLRRRADNHHRALRYAHDHGGARATAMVERVLRSVPRDRPLHLFINFLETHLPYSPPDDYVLPFLPPGTTLAQARAVNQSPFDHVTGAVVHDDTDWALLRALYRGAVLYVDGLVARLVELLRAAGRFEDALLVVTSDHGENIGDNGQMDHQCSLNDTVLRVPLLVRLPGGSMRATRDDLVQLTDVLPTVCEVVGLTSPPTQGRSLLHPVERDHVVAEYLAPHVIIREVTRTHPDFDWSPWNRALRSIRTRTRKYVSATDGRNELYDVAADPYERTNLYGDHPDETVLARTLRRWEMAEQARPLTGCDPDPAVTERLAALGYIG